MEPSVMYIEDWTPVLDKVNATAEDLLSVSNLHVGVYGTLREGQHAHHLMEGLTLWNKVTLNPKLFSLRVPGHGGFPCMLSRDLVEDMTDAVEDYVGEYMADTTPLIEVYSGIDEDILRRLDVYEGYPSLYQRRLFYSKSHNIHVALYVWNTSDIRELHNLPFVYKQDWEEHVIYSKKRAEALSNLNNREARRTVQDAPRLDELWRRVARHAAPVDVAYVDEDQDNG